MKLSAVEPMSMTPNPEGDKTIVADEVADKHSQVVAVTADQQQTNQEESDKDTRRGFDRLNDFLDRLEKHKKEIDDKCHSRPQDSLTKSEVLKLKAIKVYRQLQVNEEALKNQVSQYKNAA